MIQFEAGSLRTTMLSLRNMGKNGRLATIAAAKSAGTVLGAAVKRNVSLHDHSLQELADKGHPYARRHGSIGIHTSGSKSIGNPAFRVHTQKGTLLSALQSGPVAGGLGWRVELDAGIAPHAVFVVSGTRVMLARDVVWSTAGAPYVQTQMMREIVTTLGKRLRLQGAVRFERV